MMKECEFKFYYPRLIEAMVRGDGKTYTKFITRQWLIERYIYGATVSNRIYVFGKELSEVKTIVALNHETLHLALDNMGEKLASFLLDFIFTKKFLPVVRKYLGRELGVQFGVFH